jgi:Skp family chaperone for outer membrane proteins
MSKGMLGLLGLSLAVALVSGRITAQEPPAATRIAVVNLGEIFLNYTRSKEGKKELEAAIAPYKQMLDKLQGEITKLQQITPDPKLDPEEKAAASKKLISLRRQMEDLRTEAQKVTAKKSEKFIVDLYADIEAAIKRHADAQQIDLVLAYGEPLNDDLLKYANVTRKFNAASQGGVVPVFIRPRIDITQAVLKGLNESYPSKK